jgi:hypothetical protein
VCNAELIELAERVNQADILAARGNLEELERLGVGLMTKFTRGLNGDGAEDILKMTT